MKIALNEQAEWYVLPNNDPRGLYIDGYLKSNFDIAKREIKNNWDMVFLIDGYEGSGKSVLAQQLAFYCNPSFNIDCMAFNPDEFCKLIDGAKRFQAIIYDEAYGGLSSKTSMNAVNQAIVQKMTVIRKRNLFIFIVSPTFFDLNRYIAIWRSRALIHVYADEFKRGFFKFYNIDKKKDMHMKGFKTYDYHCVKDDFSGRYTDTWVVDQEEYDRRKEAGALWVKDQSKSLPGAKVQQIAKEIKQSIALNLKAIDLSQHDIATILGMTDQAISRYVKSFRDPLNLIEEKVPIQYESLGN